MQPTSTPSAPDCESTHMLRVARDEPGAFAELVEKYWPLVYARFYRLFRDRQEAEDLAQNVFMRVYRSRQRYRPTARFTTWLFTIVTNVGRNASRTHRRRRLLSIYQLDVPDNGDWFGPDCVPDTGESPTRPLERAELAQAVHAAIALLGYRQRAALELQFADHSYDEIAKQLAMTPRAAKSLLYRTRIELRERLTELVAD